LSITAKKIEIFCGTGGVGKTTLATSRAVYLATKNKKVLLITIDPAKRLKQVLGINDEKPGQLHPVDLSIFKNEGVGNLKALLMHPEATMRRLAVKHSLHDEFKNPLFQIFTKPYGGMNEIMALLELQYHLESNEFDTIVLDTPPGKHFIDFLLGARRINNFFDKIYVDIFMHLGKKINHSEVGKSGKILGMLVNTGVKKLLTYLAKVTGAEFVDYFVDAVSSIYLAKDSFIKGLSLELELKKVESSNWYLVTSTEHNKLKDAISLSKKASSFDHEDHYVIINKCLAEDIHDWVAPLESVEDKIKSSLIKNEDELLAMSKEHFKKILKFKDILSLSPQEQVKELVGTWESY